MKLRPLANAWVITLTCVVLALVTAAVVGNADIATTGFTLGWFVSFVLSIITVARARPAATLIRIRSYRVTLGGVVVASLTAVLAAGHTVWDDGRLGYIAVASVACIELILAWRALVAPSPRRAAPRSPASSPRSAA